KKRKDNDRKKRDSGDKKRKDNEQRNNRERGKGNKYGHDKDKNKGKNNRERGRGNKYGHDKDKDKNKDNRKRGKGNDKRKKGKRSDNGNDDGGSAEVAAEVIKLLIILNIDTWYTPYPYYGKGPNFLENLALQPGSYLRSDVAGEKYGQAVPPYYRKVFFNVEVGGQYLSPTYYGMNTVIHGRVLSILGPLFEYQGIKIDYFTYNIMKAGVDIAVFQFGNMSLSAFWQHTWLKIDSTEVFQDETVGFIFMVYPVKPISFTLKYAYMEHENRIYQSTNFRLGVHINRFEIFTGYYRHSFGESRFSDGAESGIKLWF
ncbi:MAG: hypothetical protein ABUK01_02550, partial [Leptospirales bacterium]